MFKLFKKKEKVDELTELIKRVTELESEVGMERKDDITKGMSYMDRLLWSSWSFRTSLKDEIKDIKTNFNELDKKFDALCEFLKVEFVDEKLKLSDGSDRGDERKERFYARIKAKKVGRPKGSKNKVEEDYDEYED